jgi:hypothetical protein
MKILLDVKDNKAASLFQLLGGLSYVKTKTLTPYKAAVLENIKEAVDEMKKIKSGKLRARNAEDLFNEL